MNLKLEKFLLDCIAKQKDLEILILHMHTLLFCFSDSKVYLTRQMFK